MAHRRFGGLSALDILRSADDERRIEGALKQILAASDGTEQLLSIFIDGTQQMPPLARKAAFDALMATESAEAVAALLELGRVATESGAASDDLDLYRAARRLPMTALLRHCNCDGDEAREAMEEAGLTTVGDLIRYCCSDNDAAAAVAGEAAAGAADDDIARHVGALGLETGGILGKPALRTLILSSQALVAATAALPKASSAAWPPSASADDADEDLADIDAGGADDVVHEEGPVAGTMSVGC